MKRLFLSSIIALLTLAVVISLTIAIKKYKVRVNETVLAKQVKLNASLTRVMVESISFKVLLADTILTHRRMLECYAPQINNKRQQLCGQLQQKLDEIYKFIPERSNT